jgi:membrane-associated two-gene conflict system component 1 (EACC1)
MSNPYREAGAATPRVLLTIIAAADADPDHVDRPSRQVLAELRELDLDWTRLVESTQTPPPGSKGVDASLGAVLISLSSAGVLSAVIEAVREWLRRHKDGSSVTLTIGGDTLALGSASDEAQEELVDVFVRRHGGD